MPDKNRTISIREFGRIYPDSKHIFKRDIEELRAYIDANWARNIDERKSMSGG